MGRKVYIEDIYSVFNREIIKVENNKHSIISILSLLIDVHGVSLLIDFFNSSKEADQRANLFVIKILNIVSYESIKFISKLDEKIMLNYTSDETFSNLKDFRHIIHQFEYSKFNKIMKKLNDTTGRSYDKLKPMLDMVVYYQKTGVHYVIEGTNTNLFKFSSPELQEVVNDSQSLIRSLDALIGQKKDFFIIKKSNNREKHKTISYSFVDVMKVTKINNKKLLDRLLFALDDLSEIDYFFNNVILVDDYLLEHPHIIYFLLKIIYIQLNETINNLSNFVKNSPIDCDDRKQVELILDKIDLELISRIQVFRNNLHYEKQITLNIGNENDLFIELKDAIHLSEQMKIDINGLVNIRITKKKIAINSFLHWVQS